MLTAITPSEIAHYYDVNTTAFLNFGGSKAVGALHRQIWADGVQTPRQALEYLHQLIAAELQPLFTQSLEEQPTAGQRLLRVLDVGCGVGGTATWLINHLPVQVTGVTISRRQADLAQQRVQQLGYATRCTILQADFHHLPALEPFQAAYAIESFAHASSADDFFRSISPQLLPGGRLVICDDFLTNDRSPSDAAECWRQRFRQGWHLPNLITHQAAVTCASRYGLQPVATHHLTPYLRIQPAWRAKLFYHLLATMRRSVVGQSWRGSAALQVCLRFGWSIYCAQIWQKE